MVQIGKEGRLTSLYVSGPGLRKKMRDIRGIALNGRARITGNNSEIIKPEAVVLLDRSTCDRRAQSRSGPGSQRTEIYLRARALGAITVKGLDTLRQDAQIQQSLDHQSDFEQ